MARKISSGVVRMLSEAWAGRARADALLQESCVTEEINASIALDSQSHAQILIKAEMNRLNAIKLLRNLSVAISRAFLIYVSISMRGT